MTAIHRHITSFKTSICLALAVLIFSDCRKTDSSGEPPLTTTYTNLQGHVSGLLTVSRSPYKVTGVLIVDSLTVLNIDPSVKIFFDDSASMLVRGRLVCAGDRFHPILLTRLNQFWEGIRIINSNQTSLLQFTTVEHIDITAANNRDGDGALQIVNASVTIINSIFRDNKSGNGGAVFLHSSQSLITNNVFYGNYADVFGGAIVSSASTNQITNNTFYNNSVFNYGGGIVTASPVFDEIQNNIFHRNTSRAVESGIFYYLADTSHYLSQFNFLQSGSSNPLFYSTTNFHLNVSSPCIDAGNPDSQFNDVDGTRNDQGAYGGPLGDAFPKEPFGSAK